MPWFSNKLFIELQHREEGDENKQGRMEVTDQSKLSVLGERVYSCMCVWSFD